MIKIFKISVFIFFVISANVNAEIIKVFEFTEEELTTLKVRKVKGKTKWTLGSNDNGNYIRAEAEGTGSGLGKEISIDLRKTPSPLYFTVTFLAKLVSSSTCSLFISVNSTSPDSANSNSTSISLCLLDKSLQSCISFSIIEIFFNVLDAL